MTQKSTSYRCLACSEMEDQYCFHTIRPSKKTQYFEERQKCIQAYFENLSTGTDTQEGYKLHQLTIFPEKKEEKKVQWGQAFHYEPQDSSTLPQRKPQLLRKASGAPRKKRDHLKNFYPKLERYIKKHSSLKPNFSICNKNRIEMLKLYGDQLRPQLIELVTYNRLKKQPGTDQQRWKENQRIAEKEKAKQLLDEYDKLCKLCKMT